MANSAEYMREYYQKNKERINERRRSRIKDNPEKQREMCRRWDEANREKRRQWAKERREKHPEKIKEIRRVSDLKNKDKIRARSKARKRRVRVATPPWADIKAIEEFYLNCPPGHHVDHIIPLNGKIVSGLHVLENLQYLSAVENIKKGNKYES